MMARHVPDEVTTGEKQGFSGPDATWFRGESVEYVRDLIDHDALMYEFLEPKTVHALVEEHASGKENRRLLLWSLLNFEHWCRTFLHGSRPDAT
jgi:asparagine synthase (glutamine-hydrolysing)